MKATYVTIAFAGLLVLPTYGEAGTKKAANNDKHAPAKLKAAPAQGPADWQLSTALSAHLGAQVQIGDYAMRLPEGYTEVSPPSAFVAQQKSQGFDNHVYVTDIHPNGTKAGLYTTVATPPPGMTGAALPLAVALQGAIAQKSHQWQNFVQSKPEQGRIGGLTFERVYFKGTYSSRTVTRQAHGFAYVTEDGDKIISIVAEDSEPYNGRTLPVAEAATLTFHKQ